MYDGKEDDLDLGQRDTDHQTDMNTLYARWEGFHDIHTAIKEFYVSIGRCPHCNDVLTSQPIGITEGRLASTHMQYVPIVNELTHLFDDTLGDHFL